MRHPRILLAVAAATFALTAQAKPVPVPGDAACLWGRLDIIQRSAFAARIVVVRRDQTERAATILERSQLTCKGAAFEDVFSGGSDGLPPAEVRFEF